jgi:hypothetical protein
VALCRRTIGHDTDPQPFSAVTILLSRGPALELPWDPRDLLIDELNALELARPIIRTECCAT